MNLSVYVRRLRARSDLTHLLGWCAAQSCIIPIADLDQAVIGVQMVAFGSVRLSGYSVTTTR